MTSPRSGHARPQAPDPGARSSGFGWKTTSDSRAALATASPAAGPTASDRQADPLATASPSAGDRQGLPAGDRQRGDGGAVIHQFVVPVDGGGDETDDAASRKRQSRVDNLGIVNKPIGSLRDLLRFARHAHYNLSHVDSVRAFHLAFFWIVTVPVLIVVWPILWTFVLRLHRSVTAWGLVLVCAPFVNRWADWLVWDGFDVSAWSATTWQWVSGFLLLLSLTAGAILWNERRL